jgi:hypothetical protein
MLPARRKALERAGAAVVAPAPVGDARARGSRRSDADEEVEEGAHGADGAHSDSDGGGSEGGHVTVSGDGGEAGAEPLSEPEFNKDAWKALGQ